VFDGEQARVLAKHWSGDAFNQTAGAWKNSKVALRTVLMYAKHATECTTKPVWTKDTEVPALLELLKTAWPQVESALLAEMSTQAGEALVAAPAGAVDDSLRKSISNLEGVQRLGPGAMQQTSLDALLSLRDAVASALAPEAATAPPPPDEFVSLMMNTE
jgi:hypothetical protein